MFPPSIDRLKKFKSYLLRSYQMIRKKKKGRREQKFRAVVEEAQILVAFETFFFSPTFKLLVWVSETFQEAIL